jgi:hypothetical protein
MTFSAHFSAPEIGGQCFILFRTAGYLPAHES